MLFSTALPNSATINFRNGRYKVNGTEIFNLMAKLVIRNIVNILSNMDFFLPLYFVYIYFFIVFYSVYVGTSHEQKV